MTFSLLTPDRMLFGRGCRDRVPDLLAPFGPRVVLVRGRAARWVDTLETTLPHRAELLTLHSDGEPTLPQLDAALAQARPFAADVVVAVGGGATLDLGKAVAGLMRSPHPPMAHLEVVGDGRPIQEAPCPFVAIPTTAGTGAEATKNAVIAVPDHGLKVSLRDDRMLAQLALVDPALTDDSPRALTLASGLDAITQLIEPYLSRRANPLTDALCRDTIPAALYALSRLMQTEDAAARDTMARASFLSGVALANAGLGIVHGLAGVIGGRTGAAHGALCGRLLPAALRVNAECVAAGQGDPSRFRQVSDWIADALDGDGPAEDRLAAFMDRHGLPTLRAMGVREDDHAAIAAAAARASSTKANPVTLDQPAICRILRDTP